MTRYKTINGERIAFTAAEEAARDTEEANALTEKNANQYKIDRATEYPPVVDQLDEIYHHGIDGWKAKIATIKAKYPKP